MGQRPGNPAVGGQRLARLPLGPEEGPLAGYAPQRVALTLCLEVSAYGFIGLAITSIV